MKSKDDKSNVLLVNITWNPYGWRNLYTNPRAGHKYARTHPGHESLNFDFEKKGIDKDDFIHGYVQFSLNGGRPKKFRDGGIIIFYTTNIDKKRGEIVGIYGRAHLIQDFKKYTYKGFDGNTYTPNIRAEKSLSMLFPIHLDAKKYKKKGEKLVGQSNVGYKDDAFAKKIIIDELNELNKNGIMENELIKLKAIYEYYFGALDPDKLRINNDESEQNELVQIFKNKSRKELLDGLKHDSDSPSQQETYNGKRYKRDNANIARIKLLRDSKCQICGKTIIKKDGNNYIEAAHIKPKCEG